MHEIVLSITVRPSDLILDLAAFLLRKTVAYPPGYSLPILWYDRLHEIIETRCKIRRLAEDSIHFLGTGYVVGLNVPLPMAYMRKARCIL